MEQHNRIKYAGQIRVGRIVYKNGKQIIPKYEGFKPIIVMTPSSEYGSLGPYVLKDKKGRLLENRWHSCKIFETIPATKQVYSRWDPKVIWDHVAERHVDKREDGSLKNRPNRNYWRWRRKLSNCEYPVRYPVGESKQVRRSVLYFLKKKNGKKMDYIEARKKIYFSVYKKAVKLVPLYNSLITRLDRGEKLLLIEIDGPRIERLPYYKEKFGVPDNWIEDNTILITQQVIDILVQDVEASFGHTYCLAMCLMNIGFN